jgi:hypothetical protein
MPIIRSTNPFERSIVNHFNSRRADGRNSQALIDPINGQRQRLQQSCNKANTIRNWSKVEHYLMEVEKAHGCARSWALRERLEQGHVTLSELMGH